MTSTPIVANPVVNRSSRIPLLRSSFADAVFTVAAGSAEPPDAGFATPESDGCNDRIQHGSDVERSMKAV